MARNPLKASNRLKAEIRPPKVSLQRARRQKVPKRPPSRPRRLLPRLSLLRLLLPRRVPPQAHLLLGTARRSPLELAGLPAIP